MPFYSRIKSVTDGVKKRFILILLVSALSSVLISFMAFSLVSATVNSIVAPLFAPIGLSAALGFVYGTPAFVGIFLGSLFTALGQEFTHTVFVRLLFASANLAGVFVFVRIVKRRSDQTCLLGRSSDLLRLIVGAVLTALIIASAGSLIERLFGTERSVLDSKLWGLWFLGVFYGTLLTTPWLVSLFEKSPGSGRDRTVPFIVLLLVLVVLTLLLLQYRLTWLLYISLLLVMVSALLFDLRRLGLMLNLVSLSMIVAAVHGPGLFDRGGLVRTLIPIIVFLTTEVLIVYGLVLSRELARGEVPQPPGESGNPFYFRGQVGRRYRSVVILTMLSVLVTVGGYEYLAGNEERRIHSRARETLVQHDRFVRRIFDTRRQLLFRFGAFIEALPAGAAEATSRRELRKLADQLVESYDDLVLIGFSGENRSYIAFNSTNRNHEFPSAERIAEETSSIPAETVETLQLFTGDELMVLLLRRINDERTVSLLFRPALLYESTLGLLDTGDGRVKFQVNYPGTDTGAADNWMQHESRFELAGAELDLTTSLGPEFLSARLTLLPELVLMLSLLLILLAFTYLMHSMVREAEVEVRVDARTRQLRRSQQMFSPGHGQHPDERLLERFRRADPRL